MLQEKPKTFSEKVPSPPLLPPSLDHFLINIVLRNHTSLFKWFEGLGTAPFPAPITNPRQKDLEMLKRPSSTLCLKRDSGKVTSYMETKL